MEKKKVLQYGFLIGAIIVISLLLPKTIRYLSHHLVNYIIQDDEEETEETTDIMTEEQQEHSGMYKIGDPDLYVESSRSSALGSQKKENDNDDDALALAKKYEAEVSKFDDYVSEFAPEYVEAENGIMETFLLDRENFRQTAAAYAYAKWGTDRTIVRIEFDALSEDDDTCICMITFYHTSHPDTENGAMVFCTLRKEEKTYSFT